MKQSLFIFSIASVLATAAYVGCSAPAPADDDDDGGSSQGGSAATSTTTATGVGPASSSSASSSASASSSTGGPTNIDDCVCPDCQVVGNPGAAFCTDNTGCDDNGQCDPFNEGCLCADCAGHSYCTGGGAGGGGGAGAGGGAGSLQCALDSQCPNPDTTLCLCVGCVDDGICEE